METLNATQIPAMSNLQLELLRTYTRQVSNEDLLVIRKMLADYFAQKAMNLADKVWENNNWTDIDTKRLSAEHNRKVHI
jgi:hypothetical protein